MLFNSYEFIFLLLPIAFLGARSLESNPKARVYWLLLCSLFFYAWWNPSYLLLLAASITFNFGIGRVIQRFPKSSLLALGVTSNLALIAYYKYAYFISHGVLGLQWIEPGSIILPLAISFFTFQQIAYLVDCYKGEFEPYSFPEYALFVSFFPQLIAGPIVHHSEVLPQFKKKQQNVSENLSVGCTIFFIGLFKKTVLADGISPYANLLFNDPTAWEAPTLLHAWLGVLAYSFQIYFDFSGYSDMAIGAARMLGIKLPLNFFAPYRALSISDFWRRWHMTLSKFLRDYLYIPLGGNRHGSFNRYRNLLITMLLGGLWHGAGWTFILWGLLHGIYLVTQHFWSGITKAWRETKSTLVYRFVACVLTLTAVNFAWVYFRASSLESANSIALGMIGYNGLSLPGAILTKLGFLQELGINGDSSSGSLFAYAILWLLFSFAVVWLFPTTQQFVQHFEPAHDFDSTASTMVGGFGAQLSLNWSPTTTNAAALALIAAAGILSLPEVSDFLYFQF